MKISQPKLSYPWDNNVHPGGRGQSLMTRKFTFPEIYLEWLKLQISNFLHDLTRRSVSIRMTKCPPTCRGHGHAAL